MEKRYAAIDLGSNSCRLTIADEHGDVIFKNHTATKLAEGLFSSGKLSEESIKRALDTFDMFYHDLRIYHVPAQNIRAIATAACRAASNSADLQKMIKDRTGINLEIIDEKEEAELNLLGGIKHVLGKSKYVILYDLGGASTEITLATNNIEPKTIHTISIPWGARNATEAFGTDKYTEEKGSKLRAEITKYVKKFVKDAKMENYEDIVFVATSSTPLRLVSILEGMPGYNREDMDGRMINCAAADRLVPSLLQRKPEDMAKDIHIGENRAPIFAAACIIFQTIYKELGAKEFVASLSSAQNGIIQQFVERDNGKADKICETGSRQAYADR